MSLDASKIGCTRRSRQATKDRITQLFLAGETQGADPSMLHYFSGFPDGVGVVLCER
jgi:hypothetical protein